MNKKKTKERSSEAKTFVDDSSKDIVNKTAYTNLEKDENCNVFKSDKGISIRLEKRTKVRNTKDDFGYGWGGVMIDNDLVPPDYEPLDDDVKNLREELDYVHLEGDGDTKGNQVLKGKTNQKRVKKSMTKINELKNRGILWGKKGKRNLKRSYRTKITLKKLDFGSSFDSNNENQEYVVSDFENEEREVENAFNHRKLNRGDMEDFSHKRLTYMKSLSEEVIPFHEFNFGKASGWLN